MNACVDTAGVLHMTWNGVQHATPDVSVFVTFLLPSCPAGDVQVVAFVNSTRTAFTLELLACIDGAIVARPVHASHVRDELLTYTCLHAMQGRYVIVAERSNLHVIDVYSLCLAGARPADYADPSTPLPRLATQEVFRVLPVDTMYEKGPELVVEGDYVHVKRGRFVLYFDDDAADNDVDTYAEHYRFNAQGLLASVFFNTV